MLFQANEFYNIRSLKLFILYFKYDLMIKILNIRQGRSELFIAML